MTQRSRAKPRTVRNLRVLSLSEQGARNDEGEKCNPCVDAAVAGDEEMVETETLALRQVAIPVKLQWQFEDDDGWQNMGARTNDLLLAAWAVFKQSAEAEEEEVQVDYHWMHGNNGRAMHSIFDVNFNSMTQRSRGGRHKVRNVRIREAVSKFDDPR
jgi:hypothetical protein